ncbi:MAG: murein biosynthesis integral membrane protein MurJ [Chloroflexota bacterium]|nr:murein biosynthesis integral membrane protein MurJ [Chloroflexota bacterium]
MTGGAEQERLPFPGDAEPPGASAPGAPPLVAHPGPSTGRVLAQASLILTVAALASRLLGWVRLLVIGSQFGASRELDAYFAAFRIPDAIFQLVVAGALSAALIPVFQGYRARDQEQEAWRLASSVINLVLIALAAFSLVMAIFAPLIVPIITPGFDAPTTELTVRMTRVMLLSPVFIGMGAVVSGILNSYERFAVPAIAPLLYNLAIILSAIVLAPLLGVEGLAVGVAIGSLAHLVVQLPNLASVGQRYDLFVSLAHPGVRRVAWLMGPRTLGLAAVQINFLASTLLASGQPEGSVTAYNYAFQLMQVPVGVVGVSVAVALFPRLSHDAALGRVREVRRQLSTALRLLLFIALPLTAVMTVLREPLTAVFFQYGLFSAQSTARTSDALLYFTLGLAAQSLVPVLARAFYALQDTRTPVIWAVVAVVLNVPLMALLVGPMGVGGLALALSVTASLEVLGLLWALRGRLGGIEAMDLLRSLARSTLAAGAAALLMLGALQLTQLWFAGVLDHGLGRLLAVLAISALGVLIYVVVAAALRSHEIGELSRLLGRRFRRAEAQEGDG